MSVGLECAVILLQLYSKNSYKTKVLMTLLEESKLLVISSSAVAVERRSKLTQICRNFRVLDAANLVLTSENYTQLSNLEVGNLLLSQNLFKPARELSKEVSLGLEGAIAKAEVQLLIKNEPFHSSWEKRRVF